MPAEARAEATDLLLDVLHRSYRCKDWMFALLVRHLDDAAFRDRLTAVEDNPRTARFLLHLADHPEVRIRRKTWRNWLAAQA
ncbi:hypothetical protein JNUCC0626_39925 [Lentzea sp. JNUCC 0626]|uniref:hypothetical protein n=1 Tax=Lentzea sp. JNUCC 0626 TaxID=3367513 RepID=UPI003749A8E4